MTSDQNSLKPESRKVRGRKSYKAGYAFEDRVAEAYRLLGYKVEHGRLFGGRQVDLYLELKLGDLQVRRAIECKAGGVNSDHLDRFLIKLELVKQEYPDALGTVVSGSSFTNEVRTHANAKGIQLTSYRELSAQILDAPSYAQALIREIEANERYRPQLFVYPLICHESAGLGTNSSKFLEEWLLDSSWNQLTLLGDMGTGKSFLSRMLALKLAQAYLNNPAEAPFPVLVDLRNADRQFSLEGLILTHFAKYGLSRASFEAFQFLLSEGRIVLILDGFDEMASRVTPQITTRNFHELVRCVKRSAKVLLTCRTHYFKSRTEEEEVILGGSGPESSEVARDLYWDLISRGGFRIAYLRPFTVSQVEEYVRKAHPENAVGVLTKIRKIYNLSELSQRPLLLEMIVKSIDKLGSGDVNAADLYGVFTNAWIHRDRWRDLMRPEDKLKFLTALARSLWEQERTGIEYQKLEAYVGAELASLVDSAQKLTELDGEIRTASFLVRDDSGQYGFAHSSYAEYFLAKYLAERIATGDVRALTIRRLTNEIVDFLLWMVDKNRLEGMLIALLKEEYQPLLSENALIVLYRIRRSLLIQEKGRGSDTTQLKIDMPARVQLKGAKLAQVNLEGAVLREAQFDGADLRQCIAISADLTDSSFKEASLCKGNFQDCCLRGAKVSGAKLTEVNLQGADVAGCDFTRADLTSSILTVKDLSGAVFHETVMTAMVPPPNDEVGLVAKEAVQPEWDKERVLKQVYMASRRFVARYVGGPDSEDIASEVVVYLLSHPKELERLRTPGHGELTAMSRHLAWRKLSTVLRRQERPSVLVQEIEDNEDDESGVSSDFPEHYSFDSKKERRGRPEVNEPPIYEYAADDFDFQTLMSSRGSSEELDSMHDAQLETDNLLELLGKFLSQDALKLLIERYMKEKSVKEIAATLGTSEVQVARQLNMARELARKALQPV
jgi:RNA polymerase sigma factor (sigma-70 family)